MADEQKFAPGPWSQGRTLLTTQTRRWPKERFEENEAQERRRVFAYFSSVDEGRGREVIAECRDEANARLIARAPEMHDLILEMSEELKNAGYVIWPKRIQALIAEIDEVKE